MDWEKLEDRLVSMNPLKLAAIWGVVVLLLCVMLMLTCRQEFSGLSATDAIRDARAAWERTAPTVHYPGPRIVATVDTLGWHGTVWSDGSERWIYHDPDTGHLLIQEPVVVPDSVREGLR